MLNAQTLLFTNFSPHTQLEKLNDFVFAPLIVILLE